MHSKPIAESDGAFQDDWKPTKPENPAFRCRKCGSDDVWYRRWDSDCGSFEDVKYECRGCKRTLVVAEFPFSTARGRMVFRSWCRDCCNQYYRDYYRIKRARSKKLRTMGVGDATNCD